MRGKATNGKLSIPENSTTRAATPVNHYAQYSKCGVHAKQSGAKVARSKRISLLRTMCTSVVYRILHFPHISPFWQIFNDLSRRPELSSYLKLARAKLVSRSITKRFANHCAQWCFLVDNTSYIKIFLDCFVAKVAIILCV